jgi:hypothetical protein
LNTPLLSPICATCSAHLILRDVIIRTICEINTFEICKTSQHIVKLSGWYGDN